MWCSYSGTKKLSCSCTFSKGMRRGVVAFVNLSVATPARLLPSLLTPLASAALHHGNTEW